jgi:hypothetical protein
MRPQHDCAPAGRTAEARGTPAWRNATPWPLVLLVDCWRESHPREPLPGALQRALGRSWRDKPYHGKTARHGMAATVQSDERAA